ncbi:hypothetical protein GCM10011357_16510 [Lacimicrobium alkaliphilum]|uniref:Type II secretory pathway component n=2 Tax=Lacimicrobium alkaliphilum TaxID=1526571 RepID=A0ABQ1RAE4_9ALTE|nr:hypothetical protein GCM10011357_16510 [Lacimicrobium alkaliphilum]
MLVISLFVIVVMAFLALTLTRLLSASSDSLIFEVYGLRAHQAAQSGLEAKLTEAFPLCPPGSVNSVCVDKSLNDPTACDNTTAVTFSMDGLRNCSVSSSCSVETTGDSRYYQFTSTGTCEAGDAVTSRTAFVDARVEL